MGLDVEMKSNLMGCLVVIRLIYKGYQRLESVFGQPQDTSRFSCQHSVPWLQWEPASGRPAEPYLDQLRLGVRVRVVQHQCRPYKDILIRSSFGGKPWKTMQKPMGFCQFFGDLRIELDHPESFVSHLRIAEKNQNDHKGWAKRGRQKTIKNSRSKFK